MDCVNSLLERRDQYRAEHGGSGQTQTASQGSGDATVVTVEETDESDLIDIKIKNLENGDDNDEQVEVDDKDDETSQPEDEDKSNATPQSGGLLIEELSDDPSDYVILDGKDGEEDEATSDEIIGAINNTTRAESIFSNKIEETNFSLPSSFLLSENKPAG
jgi:hypothetical protein